MNFWQKTPKNFHKRLVTQRFSCNEVGQTLFPAIRIRYCSSIFADQFSFLILALFLGCRKWSTATTSAYSALGTSCSFRSKRCIAGETVVSPLDRPEVLFFQSAVRGAILTHCITWLTSSGMRTVRDVFCLRYIDPLFDMQEKQTLLRVSNKYFIDFECRALWPKRQLISKCSILQCSMHWQKQLKHN